MDNSSRGSPPYLSTVPEQFRNGSGTVPDPFWNAGVLKRFRNGSGTDPEQTNPGDPAHLPSRSVLSPAPGARGPRWPTGQ